MGCENCNPLIMNRRGCCANDVGFGTKPVTNGRRVIEVCQKLVKMNDGSWGCGIYGSRRRPDECKNARCEEE